MLINNVESEIARGFISDNNQKIIKQILEFYEFDSDMSISIFDSNERCIHGSFEKFSNVCKLMMSNEKLWGLCEKDHSRRSKSDYYGIDKVAKCGLCHLGMYNLSLPICYDGFFYGSIITGQFSVDQQLKDAQEELLNSSLKRWLSTGYINRDHEGSIRNAFLKDVDESSVLNKTIHERLEKVNESLIEIIVHTTNRIKKINLLRHELHDPNITVRGAIASAADEIDKLKLKILDISGKSDDLTTFKKIDSEICMKYNEIIESLSHAYSNTIIFTNVIENIVSSFKLDSINVNAGRHNIIKLLYNSMKIFWTHGDKKNVVFTPIEKKYVDNKYIEVDHTLIFRVLINLYQNAVKYSYYGQGKSSPRKINTTCINDKKYFRIVISNYGTGILAEEIDQIFNEGYRGLLSSDRYRAGSGLGLYQVKEIVSAHNGVVSIESEQKGTSHISGPYLTKVIVRLPYTFKGGE